MNVYDFDNTIYKGDSSIDFWLFCMSRHPVIVLDIPKQVFAGILFKFGLIKKIRFKEAFFSFLRRVPSDDNLIRMFWDHNQHKIKEWYLRQKDEDDLIISASPHFLIEEMCQRMGITNLIASEVDNRTGLFRSENCYGIEKVTKFRIKFPNAIIQKFYSDSLSDCHMASIAEEAFIVKGEKVCNWPDTVEEN